MPRDAQIQFYPCQKWKTGESLRAYHGIRTIKAETLEPTLTAESWHPTGRDIGATTDIV